MNHKSAFDKILFGLKVRQLRLERGLQFSEFGDRTGMSISYLNEIEKGKKFPQPDKITRLASGLGVPESFLLSPELTKNLAPIGDLLQSNFLSELPLHLFGIDLSKLVEIISEAPERVSAFIGALMEIARNYALVEDHFYFAALRAWQEMHMNWFEDLERQAAFFSKKHELPRGGGLDEKMLEGILRSRFNISVDRQRLGSEKSLSGLRSFFLPNEKMLLLSPTLDDKQRIFQIAKQLAINDLGLEKLPKLGRVRSFDEAMQNFQAGYFAMAVLIDPAEFARDVRAFFELKKWDDGAFLLGLLAKYACGPEVIFQRFNVLAKEFGLHRAFFMRTVHDSKTGRAEIDKELHLNRRHSPHANGLRENYCRRWPALESAAAFQNGKNDGPLATATRLVFADSGERYLVFCVSKTSGSRSVAVTFGIEIDENCQKTIAFGDDESIIEKMVGVTCERCAVENCAERAAEPIVLRRRAARAEASAAIEKMLAADTAANQAHQ